MDFESKQNNKACSPSMESLKFVALKALAFKITFQMPAFSNPYI